MTKESLRQDALAIFQAALDAAEPRAAVLKHLLVLGAHMVVSGTRYELESTDRILVVGAGKASAVMSQALEEALGGRVADGLCVVKYGHGAPTRKIRIREAAHPVPDEAGVRAAREILQLVEDARPQDLVICLISGGGSALLPSPAEGVSLRDKQKVTELLLACGANIEEINAVRKHISRIKGGQLARAAAPARVVGLILSDVIGDRLGVIASGPTAPDPTTFSECVSILERYRALAETPECVVNHLKDGAAGRIPETPKPGDALFERVQNTIVASNAIALQSAAKAARERGYRTRVLSDSLQGEAREVGRSLAFLARRIRAGEAEAPPACILAGGETTVTVRGAGRGGRNQELALAAATELEDAPDALLLSAGTDGTDGPTEAAGAFADGSTLKRAREKGLDARDHLERNDSYNFFKPLGDLLITGPTRTNVMDVQVLLVA